jgi:alpha-glucosidase
MNRYLYVLLFGCLFFLGSPFSLWGSSYVRLDSPDKTISAVLFTSKKGSLHCAVSRAGNPVVTITTIGITVDGINYGQGIIPGKTEFSSINMSYPWRGVKNTAIDHCSCLSLTLTNTASSSDWYLDARAYDDGFAYRLRVPGIGDRHVSGDYSQWHFSENDVAWFQEETTGYEGVFRSSPVRLLHKNVKKTIGLPVTVELSEGGYVLLSEADIYGYSGMTVQPRSNGSLLSVFEDNPRGWSVSGTITTAWRVVMIVPDLNTLVNCDIIHNVCPPPDPSLFPDGMRTRWCKPGRVLWQWWAYNDPGTQWNRQKWFVDMAAKLNCQYYLVDAGWENPRFGWMKNGTDSWERLTQLCAYAGSNNVDILVWRSSFDCRQGPGIRNPKKRKEFFAHCRKAGVKGVKIDYIGSESHRTLKFYEDVTRLGTKYQIMVNFHGANKPAGESRTWPNEMTREGIHGLEQNKWSSIPVHHYTVLPFTRLAVGHGDFTPTTFQKRFLKGTTFAQQLATAILYTSPLQCWADKPDVYLDSPCLPLIQNLPCTWDETFVLKGSKIGSLAAFARRKNESWYVGILNGDCEEKTYVLDLSFLGTGLYTAMYYRDDLNDPAAIKIDHDMQVSGKKKIYVKMCSGGGFVGWFKPGTQSSVK